MDYNDLKWLMVERNKPRIMRWFRQSLPLTMKDQADWWINLKSTDKYFIIADRNLSPAGFCCLYKHDKYHKSAEFSIFTVEDTNLGYFAMKELLDYGFNTMGLNRIYSDVLEGNPALKLYEHLGFKNEGCMRKMYFKDGKYQDSMIIGILKEDYESLGCRNGVNREASVSNT